MLWAGMIITIGISGNEDDSLAMVATIALIGIAMMLYGLESVVDGHRIEASPATPTGYVKDSKK